MVFSNWLGFKSLWARMQTLWTRLQVLWLRNWGPILRKFITEAWLFVGLKGVVSGDWLVIVGLVFLGAFNGFVRLWLIVFNVGVALLGVGLIVGFVRLWLAVFNIRLWLAVFNNLRFFTDVHKAPMPNVPIWAPVPTFALCMHKKVSAIFV